MIGFYIFIALFASVGAALLLAAMFCGGRR